MTIPPRRSLADQKPQAVVADCPACNTPLRLTLEIESGTPSSQVARRKVLSEASIGALMHPVTFVSESTPLSEISELFVTAGARLVIVVSPEQKPLGVVTPTHVLRALKRHPDRALAALRALDAATSGGAMLPETTPLAVAVKLFSDEDRDFCVILGSDGRAAGVVAAADILDKLLPPQ